ncbi:hypothetical protein HPB50_010253 [Hyalomma asiaticum]|uniref:Uncharacterized protein n=1 Tax=Hyalomma asiaticum TaxID=266040 RepID=A0ACB7T7F9_HYAAI|nr:hypothetical protein HPB50_010253 [Hyalomma asiaticum]
MPETESASVWLAALAPTDDTSPACALLESLNSPVDTNDTEDVPLPPCTPTVQGQVRQRDLDDSITAAAQTPTRTEPLRAKRKQDAADIEFLEKRMRHEMDLKEKELQLETRRVALEETKVHLEYEKFMHEMADKENQGKQLETQQERFMRFIEAVVERLNK